MSIIRTQPRVVLTNSLVSACNNAVSVSQLVHKFSSVTLANATLSEPFQPLASLRPRLFNSSSAVNSVEAFKAQTLARLASVPFLVDVASAPKIERKLTAFQQAKTLAEARAIQLVTTIETGHQNLFLETLAEACAKAVSAIGFSQITSSLSARGVRRIIATDAQGRSLVSEITDAEQPSLATEVINVADGSCEKIIKAFEAALDHQGVRGTASRRFTNGAIQLEAAREFVKRKPLKESLAAQARAAQRTRRLNRQRQSF